MLFRKKKNTREFMKYEDGKIVSIEVEEREKVQAPDDLLYMPDESAEPAEPKAKVDIKGKLTPDILKRIGAIAILVFALFVAVDMYKAFFTEDASQAQDMPNEPTKQDVVTNNNAQDQVQTQTQTQNQTQTNTPNNPSNPTPTPNEEPSNTPTSPAPEEQPIYPKDIVSMIGQVNDELLSATSSEIEMMKRYTNRKTSIVSFESQTESSLASKERLYSFLSNNKEAFEKNQGTNLYTAYEKRLVNAIRYSNDLLVAIQQRKGATVFKSIYDEFAQNDAVANEAVTNEMIQFLQLHQIKYEYDKASGQIVFK